MNPDEMRAALAAKDAEIVRLREALEAAANGLDEVAELTWDKRRPDDCRHACAAACEQACGSRDDALAALSARPPTPMNEAPGLVDRIADAIPCGEADDVIDINRRLIAERVAAALASTSARPGTGGEVG